MDNNNKKVLFDPGYAEFAINYIGQVGYTYYMFNAVKNPKIKRQNFPLVSIKLEKLLRANVSFYLGCMLWACYISKFDDYEIEGNNLLGEECSQEEYTSEISFLIDFVENQYPRDYKYYKNKLFVPDEKYLPILKAYKEFLILNNGFINCSKTNQIVLPSNFKKLDENQYDYIYGQIQKALNMKNLEILFDSFDLILQP